MDFILGNNNLHTQLNNMVRFTNRALMKLNKLRQSLKLEKTVRSEFFSYRFYVKKMSNFVTKICTFGR